ncbi:mechanosensitive ion channel family protein [Hoeflea ulvae]|uniref:Mechanosensitive ion channel family protein n=1 Tax=Hoeflea ulvae TaxID=2983764 RepID=A0ABT3YBC6_9HYPH|nr:mechanosensitive ion channel domain-containing protein [Hoeflea ulvae]MCY0093172.1 mechanosensitive ion channel family protein [Hoeflea ulvae]
MAATAILVLLGWCAGFAGAAQAQQNGTADAYFETGPLNPGLVDTVRIDRDTPQATVESFLHHSRAGNYAAAAHLLDLGAIEPERQSSVGAERARQLEQILNRKVWLKWEDIPDRRDGLDVTASPKELLAGEPRRSIRLALIDLDDRPVPIRLERVKPAGGDPVWVFAAQTVDNLPALDRLYGESWLERSLPDWARQQVTAGLAAWQVIAIPVLLISSLLAGWCVYRLLRDAGQRLAPRFSGRLLGRLALSLAVLTGAIVAYLVQRHLFVFSATIDTFLGPLMLLVLLGGGLTVFVQTIDMILERTLIRDIAELEKPENREMRAFQTNLSAFRRIGIVLAVVFAAGLLMTQINLFATTGVALIGSAGVVTLILAYAARSALSNIMASLQIAISKTAAVGDSLYFENRWCYVEKINFTYVQLKTWDKRRLIVPVTYFVSEPFENWTKRDPTMTKVVRLRLHHSADVDALRARFQQFVESDDKVIDKDGARVLVVDHDATGMVVGFYATAEEPLTAWTMECELREAMLKAARELELERSEGMQYLPAERESRISDFTTRTNEDQDSDRPGVEGP